MTGPVFVDTNVFVYRHDRSDPSKQACAERWIRLLAGSRLGRLSFQVLQELYATLTRTHGLHFDRSEARDIVVALAVWRPVAVDLPTLERAWLVQDAFSVSWWDALIVAAAQTCECGVLLTEDLQHGQEFGATRVVNPFVLQDRTPEDVLEGLSSPGSA